MDIPTRVSLEHRFGYVFHGEGPYPAIADIREIAAGAAGEVAGPSGPIPFLAFEQDHGSTKSLGYRFGPLAYSSDVVGLDETAFAALAGVEVWIVDALRHTPHPTHAHVQRALEWIARVRPKRAILTNMHIDLDYRTLARDLPPGVEPAYDGLRLELPLGDARP
jgi:phosphoribosyl 1,2-cyclic phosphate phosphodiesterase